TLANLVAGDFGLNFRVPSAWPAVVADSVSVLNSPFSTLHPFPAGAVTVQPLYSSVPSPLTDSAALVSVPLPLRPVHCTSVTMPEIWPFSFETSAAFVSDEVFSLLAVTFVFSAVTKVRPYSPGSVLFKQCASVNTFVVALFEQV